MVFSWWIITLFLQYVLFSVNNSCSVQFCPSFSSGLKGLAISPVWLNHMNDSGILMLLLCVMFTWMVFCDIFLITSPVWLGLANDMVLGLWLSPSTCHSCNVSLLLCVKNTIKHYYGIWISPVCGILVLNFPIQLLWFWFTRSYTSFGILLVYIAQHFVWWVISITNS